MAEIHITKPAAARRLLRAAIRMFFVQEDELAVHIVASAAYRLISDLKSQRGRDEVGDYYLTMVFYAVRDYRRGTLPRHLADDAETMKWIREMAEAFPITATSKYDDISASACPTLAKEFWNKRNKVYNFLKHADNDASKHISLDEVDNLPLLMQACGSYVDLTGANLGAEAYVLWSYWKMHSGITEDMPKDWVDIVEHRSHDEQLTYFSDFLTELKRQWGET